MANKRRSKTLNQLRVFRELYLDSAMTKKELSKKTGLSTPTVTKALTGLSSRKLITEKGRKDIPTGRKPRKYGLNNNSIYGLGVDLEIPDLKLAIYDLSRRMIATKGSYMDMDDLQQDPAGYIAKKISLEFKDLVYHQEIAENSIIGAGIATSGIVKNGKFRPFSRFDSSSDIKLKNPLEEELEFPTSFGNDVDLQLLSELDRIEPITDSRHVAIYFGARLSGKRQPTVRIGGSIAVGGEICRGAGGSAGEFGHMSVTSEDSDLPPTNCGNDNCLESFVNDKLEDNDGLSVPDSITRAIKQKIKDLVFVFSPSLIIVDMDAFPEITDEVMTELESFTSSLEKTMGLEKIRIKKPMDRDRSATRGAVINHFNHLLLDPDNFSVLMENQNTEFGR
ncbi:ROK family transcriptional regulator [Candidatus Bipolaricaulota bacterium]|nr:ROK family transcriptional regulator [Candidatus Bipolaricaulota bacterium]